VLEYATVLSAKNATFGVVVSTYFPRNDMELPIPLDFPAVSRTSSG
jgi:hypothetical protein